MTTSWAAPLRLPVPLPAATRVAAALGVAVGVVGWAAAWPALDNLYGPFGERTSSGSLAALGAGAAAGVLGLVGFRWLARRSAAALVIGAAVAAVAAVVLFPNPIDVHESFVPVPNERQSCRGWEFRHYPPGVMDGSATDYCVGLEAPLPRG